MAYRKNRFGPLPPTLPSGEAIGTDYMMKREYDVDKDSKVDVAERPPKGESLPALAIEGELFFHTIEDRLYIYIA